MLASIVFAWAYTRRQGADQTITVTGSAKKRIKSDLVVWRANISYQSAQLSEAYGALKDRVPRVKAYLVSKGVPEGQIVVSSISTKTMQDKDEGGEETGQVNGYVLSQTLEVRSDEMDKITKISREVTELIDQGILLESQAPEYHYTKLSDLKIEMLGEAAKDAKVRAQQIASSTGSEVGSVRSARWRAAYHGGDPHVSDYASTTRLHWRRTSRRRHVHLRVDENRQRQPNLKGRAPLTRAAPFVSLSTGQCRSGARVSIQGDPSPTLAILSCRRAAGEQLTT